MRMTTPALITLAGLATLASGCSTSNEAARAAADERGQIKLAELVEGREAGEPVRCINTFANQQIQIIDRTALYVKHRDTIYVNTPKYPNVLDDDDVLYIERFGSQLCRNESIRLLERNSGIFKGFVSLEDFVPYKKVS